MGFYDSGLEAVNLLQTRLRNASLLSVVEESDMSMSRFE